MATKAVVVFGTSNVYWGLGLCGADVVIVCSQNQPPEGYLFKGEPPVQSNLKGSWVKGFTHECPGPLTFTQLSITAWAIAPQPS